jgi:hypothetical protein
VTDDQEPPKKKLKNVCGLSMHAHCMCTSMHVYLLYMHTYLCVNAHPSHICLSVHVSLPRIIILKYLFLGVRASGLAKQCHRSFIAQIVGGGSAEFPSSAQPDATAFQAKMAELKQAAAMTDVAGKAVTPTPVPKAGLKPAKNAKANDKTKQAEATAMGKAAKVRTCCTIQHVSTHTHVRVCVRMHTSATHLISRLDGCAVTRQGHQS